MSRGPLVTVATDAQSVGMIDSHETCNPEPISFAAVHLAASRSIALILSYISSAYAA